MGLHAVILAPSAILCILLYSRVTAAFFCSYDDFYELHRAKFEDARDPARIFTTAHYRSQRYRPLNRAVNFVTYRLGGVNAFPFRLRNLVFHLVNIGLLYGLGFALFSSVRVAALGALLFGIHPLANQSLIGAVVTNSIAYSFVLAGCLVCIVATDARRYRPAFLVGGLVLGWLGLLTYDPAVVVFPLIGLVVVLRTALLPAGVDRRNVVVLVVGTLAGLAAYLAMRLLFMPSGFGKAASNLPTLARLGKDTALYAFALINPVDPVLANAVLGAPFPSEIRLDGSVPILIAVGLILLALGTIAMVGKWLKRRSERLSRPDQIGGWFLGIGIALQMIPILIFGKRPSETYLYLPVAFASLLFAFLAWRFHSLARGRLRHALGILMIGVLALFGAATWVRNERVFCCGASAERILAGIPCPGRDTPNATVRVSNLQGAKPSRRYGFYGFRGTDTIGDGGHAGPALTAALQLVCGDPRIRGEVVTPDQLRDRCRPDENGAGSKGFWVDSEGRVFECAFGR